jgi:hypothetical protein
MEKSLFRRELKRLSGQQMTDWLFREGMHTPRLDIRRGVIEYNRDPHYRGRVLVRVLEDGPEMKISDQDVSRTATFDLAWCEPLFPFGGGMGYGAFVVPPVGSRVFVLYERGNPDQPLYFGGWYANSPRQRRYGATKTTLKPPNTQHEDEPGYNENGEPGGDYRYPPKPTPYGGHWVEEQGPEIPLELFNTLDHTPDNQLFFKTLKGAALLVRERDEIEEMTLIDRLGAELKFESATELQEDGVTRRKMQTASSLRPMGLGSLYSARHKTSLLTPTGAGLELESGLSGNDSALFQIHPEAPGERNKELQTTRMAVELDEGEQRLRVLYIEDGTTIGEITFDAVSKRIDIQGLEHIRLQTDSRIDLEAPEIRIKGDVEIDGELRHRGGERLLFIDNDNSPHDSPMRNAWATRPQDVWGDFPEDSWHRGE